MSRLFPPEGDINFSHAVENVLRAAEKRRQQEPVGLAVREFGAAEAAVSRGDYKRLMEAQAKALGYQIIKVNRNARGIRRALRLGGHALRSDVTHQGIAGGYARAREERYVTPPLLIAGEHEEDGIPRTGTQFTVHAIHEPSVIGPVAHYVTRIRALDVAPIVFMPGASDNREVLKTLRVYSVGTPTSLSAFTDKDKVEPLPKDSNDPLYLDLYSAVANARIELGEKQTNVLTSHLPILGEQSTPR